MPLLPRTLSDPELWGILNTEHCTEVVRTGSREICNPAPADTDEDWLVRTRNIFSTIHMMDRLVQHGYKLLGDEEYPMSRAGHFVTYRKGEMNVILTHTKEFYRKFKLATELAKRFNLLDKGDRVALFNGVLYGKRSI